MSKSSREQFKVVLLGEGRVGKTSIVTRYCQNSFSDRVQTTVQAAYQAKKLTLSETPIQLAVWDTAGQERFHALGPIYYRDADGAVLAYDVTDPESFEKVKKWVKELRSMLGMDVQLVICGNKIDLERLRQVDESEAVEFAESVSAKHFNTSAKLNKGVEEAFLALAKMMLNHRTSSGGSGSSSSSGKKGKKGGKKSSKSNSDFSNEGYMGTYQTDNNPRKKTIIIDDDDGSSNKKGDNCCG